MTLEELKKRATASEAVLIETVEKLVPVPDYREIIAAAVRKTGPPDPLHGFSMRNWLDAVISNIEKP